MRLALAIAVLFVAARPARAQEQPEQAASAAEVAQGFALLQSQVDALARLPAEEAEARRARASAYVDAAAQLVQLQDALADGQADVTDALGDVQSQLDEIASSGGLGQTAEEVRWTRASVASLQVAAEEIGRRDLFLARNLLTVAAVQLARARAVALGG